MGGGPHLKIWKHQGLELCERQRDRETERGYQIEVVTLISGAGAGQ